jgi:hypothetical protein
VLEEGRSGKHSSNETRLPSELVATSSEIR